MFWSFSQVFFQCQISLPETLKWSCFISIINCIGILDRNRLKMTTLHFKNFDQSKSRISSYFIFGVSNMKLCTRWSKWWLGIWINGPSPTDPVYLKNAESKHFICQMGYIWANEIGVVCHTAFWLSDAIPRYLYHSNIFDLSTKGP